MTDITTVHHCDWLIWLGAGSASQPVNLIDKAKQVLLLEARSSACQKLSVKFNQQRHIRVCEQLLSENGGEVNFTEYNLAEFSALAKVTGLSELFPGLTLVKSGLQPSITLSELLAPLALSGSNNTLVIDIADLSLALLKQLQANGQLSHFNQLYLQVGNIALYQGAATRAELNSWLEQQGFMLQAQDNADPDLPWLQFSLNPLWQPLQQSLAELQQAQQANAELTIQLDTAKQHSVNEKQQYDQQKAELTKQLEQLNQQSANESQQYELQKAELTKQRDQAKQQASEEVEIIQKQAAEQKLEFEQKLSTLTTQLANTVSEKDTLQQQFSAAKVAAEKSQAELTSQLAGKDAELQQALKQRQTAEQHLSSVNEQLTQQTLAAEQQKAVLTKENEAIRQQLSQVNAQYAELQAKHSELADKHTKLQQHSDHRIGELKTALAAAEQQQAATAQQLKDAQANLAALKLQLQEAEQKLQQAAQQATLEKLLDDKLNALAAAKTEELNKAVGNIKNHVNTGLGNVAKQLEAFMGIQSYLEKGIKPLSFHGWPISPDIGLYIAGLIDANNYDVIIEFGSGTSTVLMAKALLSKQRGVTQKMLSEKHGKPSNELMIAEGDYNDLPARIVTFEHNSKYHAQTLKALQDNGVEHLVDLVHAPLVDYQYKDGSQYLYYSCADKLAELAKVFKGRKTNMLVLVDGPPGATNKNARFPALPHLLNELSQHAFTVIMDDYNRAEEKEIVELWKSIAKDRCLNPAVEVIQSEKGLAVVTLQ